MLQRTAQSTSNATRRAAAPVLQRGLWQSAPAATFVNRHAAGNALHSRSQRSAALQLPPQPPHLRLYTHLSPYRLQPICSAHFASAAARTAALHTSAPLTSDRATIDDQPTHDHAAPCSSASRTNAADIPATAAAPTAAATSACSGDALDSLLQALLSNVASLNATVEQLTWDMKLLSAQGKVPRMWGRVYSVLMLTVLAACAGIALHWHNLKEHARTIVLEVANSTDLHEAGATVLQKTVSATLGDKEFLRSVTNKVETIMSNAASQLMSRPDFIAACATRGANLVNTICTDGTCQKDVQNLLLSMLNTESTIAAFSEWMRSVMDTEEARSALREYATASVLDDETCQRDFTDLLLSSTREVMQSAEFQKDAQAVLWEAVKSTVTPWSSSRSQTVSQKQN